MTATIETGADPLLTQRRRVQEARGGVALLRQAVEAVRAEFETRHGEMFRTLQAAQDTLSAEEDSLRQLAVGRYHATGNKNPVAGVTIRIVRKVEYDPDVALAWAKQNNLALLLDKKALDKIALATPLPFAAVHGEPHAQIATDLSAEAI